MQALTKGEQRGRVPRAHNVMGPPRQKLRILNINVTKIKLLKKLYHIILNN
jgi:hypothetical protein